MTQQGSDGPYVAGKPHDACERDVHVDALEHLAMTATWDGLDPCTWAKTRQP